MLATMRASLPSALAAAALLLAGCGSAPDPVGPSGVDGLVIPTPSPRADDFVARISNPWLAWTPGARREYAGTDDAGRPVTRTVVVRERTERIAGVRASVIVATQRRRVGDGPAVEETTYAAQDRRGNVWLLGRDGPGGSWRAGERGARAGLLMPATPRRGDGFEGALVDGEAVEVSTVLQLAASGAAPTLLIERDHGGQGAIGVREYYRRGVGLVESSAVDGSGRLTALAAP